jgi:hypothetical protein
MASVRAPDGASIRRDAGAREWIHATVATDVTTLTDVTNAKTSPSFVAANPTGAVFATAAAAAPDALTEPAAPAANPTLAATPAYTRARSSGVDPPAVRAASMRDLAL